MNNIQQFLEVETKEFEGMTWIVPGWLKDHDTRLINFILSEVEREVEKKQYYSDDGQQYVTSIEDISTIINNMKVK